MSCSPGLPPQVARWPLHLDGSSYTPSRLAWAGWGPAAHYPARGSVFPSTFFLAPPSLCASRAPTLPRTPNPLPSAPASPPHGGASLLHHPDCLPCLGLSPTDAVAPTCWGPHLSWCRLVSSPERILSRLPSPLWPHACGLTLHPFSSSVFPQTPQMGHLSVVNPKSCP